MDQELKKKYDETVKMVSVQFGDDLDLSAILFIIGVQELGKGFVKLSKNEKIDVMHIAICTLLEPYGYYIFEGLDSEGWPHWILNEKLPPLKPGHQLEFMKQAVVDYFKNREPQNS